MWGHCCNVKIDSGVLKEKDKLVLWPLDKEVIVRGISVGDKLV